MRRLVILGLICLMFLLPGLVRPAAAQSGYGGSGTVHVVQFGETLYGIAMHYGVPAQSIAAANNIYNPDLIYAGQRLVIPGSTMPGPSPMQPPPASGVYIVQLGDTLSSIAYRFGTTVSALMYANNLTNPNYIYAGQQLVIPGGQPAPPIPPGPPGPPGPHPCGQRYTVCRGDTLSGIAVRYGTTVTALATVNGLSYPYLIYPGQQLFIPCGPGGHPGKPGGHPPAKPTPKPSLKPAACAREIQIVQPREQEHVSGVVQIVGSAKIADFQFYKLEYAASHTPLANAFHSINEVHRTPAWDTVLGTWYVGNMPAGPYTLRLTVVDNRGQYPQPCDVHIHLNN